MLGWLLRSLALLVPQACLSRLTEKDISIRIIASLLVFIIDSGTKYSSFSFLLGLTERKTFDSIWKKHRHFSCNGLVK